MNTFFFPFNYHRLKSLGEKNEKKKKYKKKDKPLGEFPN